MSNLIDIQSQIEKLQKQADDIKNREFDKTIQEIIARMQAFGISIKDIHSALARGGKPKSKSGRLSKTPKVPNAATAAKAAKAARSTKGAVVAPKYRGPNGETWSGRGLMPRWMTALVAQGREKGDFAIGS